MTSPDNTAQSWRDIATSKARRTAGPVSTTTITFEAVISTWHQRPNCEMNTKRGDTCSRPATMRINQHGCEQILACRQHVETWRRSQLLYQGAGLSPRCAHCGRVFRSLDDAVTVTAL